MQAKPRQDPTSFTMGFELSEHLPGVVPLSSSFCYTWGGGRGLKAHLFISDLRQMNCKKIRGVSPKLPEDPHCGARFPREACRVLGKAPSCPPAPVPVQSRELTPLSCFSGDFSYHHFSLLRPESLSGWELPFYMGAGGCRWDLMKREQGQLGLVFSNRCSGESAEVGSWKLVRDRFR